VTRTFPGHDSSYVCDYGERTGVAYVGGTSISSPIWAGYTAVVNQVGASRGLEPVGFLNPTLYAIGKSAAAYSASFFDIGGDGQVSGLNSYPGVSNGCPSTSLAYFVGDTLDYNPTGTGYKYAAQTGYDLATGWGSPRCALADLLAVVPSARDCHGKMSTFKLVHAPISAAPPPRVARSGMLFASGSCDLNNANLTCTIDLTNYQLCLVDLGLYVTSILTLQAPPSCRGPRD